MTNEVIIANIRETQRLFGDPTRQVEAKALFDSITRAVMLRQLTHADFLALQVDALGPGKFVWPRKR